MNWEQEFQKILGDPELTEQDRIEKMLDLGLDFLGLGIGLVSHIDNDVYKVMYACSPGDMIEPGTIFSVGSTYCCHTLQANDSVGFHNAGVSEIATHPCYAHFKLESYIGAPITRDGKVIGTVNFSAAAARDPFTEDDFHFIDTLANWLGSNSQ